MFEPTFKRLRVRNFQPHSWLSMDFGPVTTIRGRNGAGKTALIRALKWLCLNDGKVRDLKKHDTGFVQVQLDVDDTRITRRAGDSNHYKIGNKKLKRDSSRIVVPHEVSRILNVGPDNFQGQLDSPFWFMQSAPQIGRELNRIVNIGVIDATVAAADIRVRKAKSKVEVSRDRLVQARRDRDELSWVVEADKELAALEDALEDTVRTKERIDTLEGILSRLDTNLRCQNKDRERLRDLESIRLPRRVEELSELQSRIEYLERVLGELKELEEDKCEKEKSLRSLSKRLTALVGEKCPLCGTRTVPES